MTELTPSQAIRAAVSRSEQICTLEHARSALNDVIHLPFFTGEVLSDDFMGAVRHAMRELDAQAGALHEMNRHMAEQAYVANLDLVERAARVANKPQ